MEMEVGNAAAAAAAAAAADTGDEFMNLHICKRKKKLMRHPIPPLPNPTVSHSSPIRAQDENPFLSSSSIASAARRRLSRLSHMRVCETRGTWGTLAPRIRVENAVAGG
jgi:hypothetical protein